MMKLKWCNCLLILLLLQITVTAQTNGYRYQAAIDEVAVPGFYNIALSPEIYAHVKLDNRDLRIVDEKGKWIPHIIREPVLHNSIKASQDVKIISKKLSSNTSTFIVEAADSITSELTLEIKNTLAERYCTLTASEDLSVWYIINDSISIRPAQTSKNGNSYFSIYFPQVNYKYYKIAINNSGLEPLNIVGISSTVKTNGDKNISLHNAIENPECRIEQVDSGGVSVIKVIQAKAYHFDKISLALSGSTYYRRHVELYFPSEGRHTFATPGRLINSFQISNNSSLEFSLPSSDAGMFYLVIRNEDSPPLKVLSVKTYNSYYVATVWLEKKEAYRLIMDNDAATVPNYDLQLRDIPAENEVKEVRTGQTFALPEPGIPPVTTQNKNTMWLVIGLAAVVLLCFTWKLVQELNKSKV